MKQVKFVKNAVLISKETSILFLKTAEMDGVLQLFLTFLENLKVLQQERSVGLLHLEQSHGKLHCYYFCNWAGISRRLVSIFLSKTVVLTVS